MKNPFKKKPELENGTEGTSPPEKVKDLAATKLVGAIEAKFELAFRRQMHSAGGEEYVIGPHGTTDKSTRDFKKAVRDASQNPETLDWLIDNSNKVTLILDDHTIIELKENLTKAEYPEMKEHPYIDSENSPKFSASILDDNLILQDDFAIYVSGVEDQKRYGLPKYRVYRFTGNPRKRNFKAKEPSTKAVLKIARVIEGCEVASSAYARDFKLRKRKR